MTAERTHSLAAWHARFAAVSGDPVRFWLRDATLGTQLDLRGDAGSPAFSGQVQAVLGCALPPLNHWTGTRARSLVSLGPDQWLYLAEDVNTAIEPALRSALGGLHHSLVDLSASRVALELGGRFARVVLAKGMTLDLARSAFGPDRVAQTLLAKVAVVLQGIGDETPAFRLLLRASFADYAAAWLLDAVAECVASGDDAERLAAQLAR